MKKSILQKMNLQFFAGEETPIVPEGEVPTNEEVTKPEDNAPEESIEERYAKMLAETKRLKAANDKLAAEAAEKTRKLRDKMSETERLNEEKIEREAAREAEFQELKRENAINRMSKSFLALGYSEKQAEEAAKAQLDNDFESLVTIQKEVQTAREKIALANYMKTLPVPPAGSGEGSNDPFLAGFDA